MDTANFLPVAEGLFSVGTLWTVVKILSVIGMLIYILFAAVIIKQTDIMSQTLDDPANKAVRICAWFHFLFAVAITVLIIVVPIG